MDWNLRTTATGPWLAILTDQIQLTDVFEAFVERLDKHLDEIQDSQLRLAAIDTKHEEKCCIVAVDELRVRRSRVDEKASRVLEEVADGIFSLRD